MTIEDVAESDVETAPASATSQSQSFEPQGDGPITASAPALRIPRNIRVLRQDGFTIDYISLQTYCQRSLPSEWIASWGNIGPGSSGTNCLNAGAVAIRTYAIGFSLDSGGRLNTRSMSARVRGIPAAAARIEYAQARRKRRIWHAFSDGRCRGSARSALQGNQTVGRRSQRRRARRGYGAGEQQRKV